MDRISNEAVGKIQEALYLAGANPIQTQVLRQLGSWDRAACAQVLERWSQLDDGQILALCDAFHFAGLSLMREGVDPVPGLKQALQTLAAEIPTGESH